MDSRQLSFEDIDAETRSQCTIYKSTINEEIKRKEESKYYM